MSLKHSLLFIFLTPSILTIISISILLYFNYKAIVENIDFIQQGLSDDKNSMLLSQLARIKQILEIDYGSLVSDLYVASQFQQKIKNEAISLKVDLYDPPSLNIDTFSKGNITPLQKQLYDKNKYLFDFWYVTGENEASSLSKIVYQDYIQSSLSSILLRASSLSMREQFKQYSYSQYFINSKLLKIIPPTNIDITYLTNVIDDCNNKNSFKDCQNLFSETYSKNQFWHTQPKDYELTKQISNLCAINYEQKLFIFMLLIKNFNNSNKAADNLYSILCQQIPLQDMYRNFTSINSTSGFNTVVMDPVSTRQIYNNNKLNLTENDNFTSLLQYIKATPQQIQSLEQEYQEYLQNFKLSDSQSLEFQEAKSKGIKKTVQTENGLQDYLLQMIIIRFKEQKSDKIFYYNLYTIVSWVNREQLIQDSNQLKDDVLKFILISLLVCAFVIFLILAISFLHAIKIQMQTERPIEELTHILQNINTDIFNETKETHSKQLNFELQEDLQQISENFSTCQELKYLFETFRQMFLTIQYANEAYFKGDQASSLIHWAQAVVFFHNIKNKRAHGISLNNLGNIHLIELRFNEAIDCYEKSIEVINDEMNERQKLEILEQDKKLLSQNVEFDSFKDFNFIKLIRIIQYLHCNVKKYNGVLNFQLQEGHQDFFENKLQFYEKEIMQIIQVLDIDMKRDCLCYMILCTCYLMIKNEEKVDYYLENIENIIAHMDNFKQYQTEFLTTSPVKLHGTNSNDSHNQSNINTPLSQIDLKFNKLQRLTLFTQVSLNPGEEQHSSGMPPPKQSNSSITFNVNSNINQKQHIFTNLNEKKNFLSTKNKPKDENYLFPAYKGFQSQNKVQLQQKVLPQILQKRYKKNSQNQFQFLKNSEITETIFNEDEQDQGQDQEFLKESYFEKSIPSTKQTVIKNPFSEKQQNKITIKEKPQHLLQELSKNLPAIPSISNIDFKFQESSDAHSNLNNKSKQNFKKNRNSNNNNQQISYLLNNSSCLDPLNIKLNETFDQSHFSFYERQNKNANFLDQTSQFDSKYSEMDQNNHILNQATTPDLPFARQGTQETIQTVIELPVPQQVTQIPELTLLTTDRMSQEDNKLKRLTPLKIEKKLSSPRNSSWKEDSPQVENRIKRVASQSNVNRGKNLSIFNKPAQQKQESPFQNIPIEIFQQKILLLKAFLNQQKSQSAYEQVELITQIFENYQRYYLQDRLESLKLLSRIFNKQQQDLYLKELNFKFREAKWDVKIVVHAQSGDQNYSRVEMCIKNVVDLIQKVSPNKKNKYSVYLNNDIQEELMSDSYGNFNFNFLSNFDQILKKQFHVYSSCSKNAFKENSQNEVQQQSFWQMSYDDLNKKSSSSNYINYYNNNNSKKDLLKQHEFVIQAIKILRKYTNASLKKETKSVGINNIYIQKFYSLTEQLNDAKFVNLFLIFWKLIFKYYGQDLNQIDDSKKENNNDSKQNENIILSIFEAEDEQSIYDTIFILVRMKSFLTQLNIKVIVRIILKNSYNLDLCQQNQIAKQAKKYVQLMQLNNFIDVISSSNQLNDLISSIREPIRYLGNQLIIEKI